MGADTSDYLVSNFRHSPSVLSGSRQHAQEALTAASPRSRQNSDFALILPVAEMTPRDEIEQKEFTFLDRDRHRGNRGKFGVV